MNDMVRPLLVISKRGAVVFLFENNRGIVVCSGCDIYPVGYYCKNWNVELFSVFTGNVNLSNIFTPVNFN